MVSIGLSTKVLNYKWEVYFWEGGESKVQSLTNKTSNLNQYMHETYLNNMKVKACMKIVDTIFDHLETL